MVMTRLALRVVLVTGPIATEMLLTHTFANEGVVGGRARNFVVGVTATACDPVRVVSVKVPADPAVPHVPGVLEPLTDATTPCASRGSGGGTTTSRALRVVPEVVPTAPANAPTHTLANDGEATFGATYFVVSVTATSCVPLRVVSVNVPAVPVPHVPDALEPFTDATEPNAPAGVAAPAATPPLTAARLPASAKIASRAAERRQEPVRRKPRVVRMPYLPHPPVTSNTGLA